MFALENEEIRGGINIVTPNPATNEEFTKAMGKVLSRPTIFAVPEFAARLAFGEMANEMLLSSQRVLPKRLSEAGYQFQYPDLESALRHLLRA
jgi:NAD dependent epimerase/dehydratase family enzyme